MEREKVEPPTVKELLELLGGMDEEQLHRAALIVEDIVREVKEEDRCAKCTDSPKVIDIKSRLPLLRTH